MIFSCKSYDLSDWYQLYKAYQLQKSKVNNNKSKQSLPEGGCVNFWAHKARIWWPPLIVNTVETRKYTQLKYLQLSVFYLDLNNTTGGPGHDFAKDLNFGHIGPETAGTARIVHKTTRRGEMIT